MKNNQLKNLIALTIIVIVISISACVKDNFKLNKLTLNNIEWRPNIAVPVAFANLSLRDLVQDYDTTELFVQDETGFLFIMYNTRVMSVSAENLVNISNQAYTETIVVPDLSIINNKLYAKKEMTKDFAVTNNERIDSIVLKTCELTVTVSSSFLHTGAIKITFPTIKLNNQQLIINVPISYATGNFFTSQDVNLASAHFDLTNGATNYNQLPYTIELWLDDSGSPVNSSDDIDVTFDFSNIKFSSAFGYFSQKNINIPLDTVTIDMYVNALEGNAKFEDPKLNVYIHNSFGMELQANINNLSAFSKANNSTYSLLAPSLSNIVINAPGLNQIGQFVTTKVLINKSNSNIYNIMGNLPYYIFYSVDALTNPTQITQTNFLLDTSRFDVDLEVEIPLWGSAQYFVLQDTVEFNVAEFFEDLNPIDWVMFRTNITNGFPTEIGVQGYFTDSLYNVVDSLFERETEFISSGQLNSEGRVIQATLRTTDILFPRNRIKNLIDVKYVLFRGYASTSNNAQTAVKVYSNYGVDIQMALQAQFSINQTQADTLY